MVERAKYLLWHGNAERALGALVELLFAVEELQQVATPARTFVQGLQDFGTYIRNNQDFIPTSASAAGRARRSAPRSPESTVHQVVSKRFVKKRQMQVLNDQLDDAFRRWFPHFREAA